MDSIENLPAMSEADAGVFNLFYQRALELGSLSAAIHVDDVRPKDVLPSGGDIRQSLLVLMEQGYLDRAGGRRFAITPMGFESYACSNIVGYSGTEDAIQDAVAAGVHTDTDAVMAGTGESRQLVNHVLRLLQRNRDIWGFSSESDRFYVTGVSAAFKLEREAHRLQA